MRTLWSIITKPDKALGNDRPDWHGRLLCAMFAVGPFGPETAVSYQLIVCSEQG